MQRLAKFWRHPPAERWLLVSAVFYLVASKVALWLVPFRVIYKHLPRRVQEPASQNALPAERIAWAIQASARHLPGTWNCLVQALAIQPLLAHNGHMARLRIGVAKDEGGKVDMEQIKAHAWVECEGKIILGGASVSQFSAFPPMENQRR